MSPTQTDRPLQPTGTPGLSYSVATSAPSPAPLVVLVSELTGNRRWWDPLLTALAAADQLPAQIATYDLRGRGDAVGREAANSLADQVADLHAIIAANTDGGPRPVVAVGHGFGVRVAAAGAAAGGIDAIVAIDGPRAADVAAAVEPSARLLEIDETAARLDVTYPQRNAYLTYWQSQPWFGAAGVGRAARDALTSDLGGSGFGWRPRINRAAVLADVAQWTTPTPSLSASVAGRSVLIVAEGAGPDGVAPHILEDVGIENRQHVAAHHFGLVFQERPLAAVATIISEVLDQVASSTEHWR